MQMKQIIKHVLVGITEMQSISNFQELQLHALFSSGSTSLFSPSTFSESECAFSKRSSSESSSNYNNNNTSMH